MYYTKGSLLVSRVTFNDSVRICLSILELVFEWVNTYIEPSVMVNESFEESEDVKRRRVLDASSLVPEPKHVCLRSPFSHRFLSAAKKSTLPALTHPVSTMISFFLIMLIFLRGIVLTSESEETRLVFPELIVPVTQAFPTRAYIAEHTGNVFFSGDEKNGDEVTMLGLSISIIKYQTLTPLTLNSQLPYPR